MRLARIAHATWSNAFRQTEPTSTCGESADLVSYAQLVYQTNDYLHIRLACHANRDLQQTLSDCRTQAGYFTTAQAPAAGVDRKRLAVMRWRRPELSGAASTGWCLSHERRTKTC